ncbi:MAG: nicotinate phosphoribosyltransferase, partial [Alphaproteobacteria bacterium]
MPGRGPIDEPVPEHCALFTDLYELKMAQSYVAEGMAETAVFSLFVRRLPEERNYLLACGQERVLSLLENLRFDEEDIAYLRSIRQLDPGFVDWLRAFRFHGEVYAVPEGTPVFANEPIMEIVAPIAEAQIIETLVMNEVTLATVLASKAARVVTAAAGRTVVDFAARRMMGVEAAVEGARAFYIAGVESTSNVLAGKRYGIPVAGTMAHSFVQAHESEAAAFRAFAENFPGTTLLVDTYDTMQGVRSAIALATDPERPIEIGGIRLDSGDLGALAREARAALDAAGLQAVKIFASSGLDEYRIADLVAAGAPIDGFGVGTAMGVADDAPALDIVYKLCAYGGRGRTKLAEGKPIRRGRKQVFRHREDGQD